MSDSSGDEMDNDKWVFYKDRPEWEDVTPVPQEDSNIPVVSIAYSEKFKDVYDYFRAVLQRKEKSERALELTKDAVSLNPANYTVWVYRREILKALNKDLYEELEYTEKMINYNLKNYQVWHHRRVIVELLQDGSNELQLTENVLDKDAKNYHAWQHRQWAIRTFNLFDDELSYVDELLKDDIRNNSAWNQRHFVLNNTTGFTDEVLRKEISYTLEKISVAKNNESAWNYLRGLLFHEKEELTYTNTVKLYCEHLYSSGNRSPYLLAMIVELCEGEITKGNLNDPVYNFARVEFLCEELANKYDIIRVKYWKYVCEMVKRKLIQTGDSNCAFNE